MTTNRRLSPALSHQSESYPASWHGMVPRRIRMAKTIRPDMPFLCKPGTIAQAGEEYDAWVNSHGAVSAVCENGELLGVKPYEFGITGWHKRANMQPHQQRVVDEKAELDEKLKKLTAFLESDLYAGLEDAERNRLWKQTAIMADYSEVLGERIAAFEAE